MAETPKVRGFRTADAKPGPKRAGRARRRQIRRKTVRPAPRLGERLRKPAALKAALIGMIFAILAGLLLAWTREQPMVVPGRVADETRLVRTAFSVEDAAATERERQRRREAAPRVYYEAEASLRDLENALLGLPTALADAETLEDVAPEIRERFTLTQERLDAIREHVVAGEADQQWGSRVRSLAAKLREIPAVDARTYQIEQLADNPEVLIRRLDGPDVVRIKGSLVNVASEQYKSTARRLIVEMGFEPLLAEMIHERLTAEPRPTLTYKERATEEVKEEAARSVEPALARYDPGRALTRRGQRITDEAASLVRAEAVAHAEQGERLEVWSARAGALVGAALITIAASLYIALFCRRARRNPLRTLAISTLSLSALAVTCLGSAGSPGLLALFAATPTIFVAVILVIAYEQRTALALSSLHALLVAAALGLPAATLGALLAGAGVVVWRLDEIRQRDTLIKTGFTVAAALAVSLGAAKLLTAPMVEGVWPQILTDLGLAAGGGVLVGFVTLGILPGVEKIFDITTGMTLIELRDPKNPLLRELQQRAPGTYSHSLTVATLAETAAESIGADGLHLYVGALYHDIGKMNKPEYFVENQTPGFSPHAKLSPAMSLLVIVGHVKDGVELAREYSLPRSLLHYIESHHGTTLVEYFYHAAKKKADESASEKPEEIEYRYPGPKPRTREAAILMLCDAVESATRAMSDPTPSRIEGLVHELASKRLLDGQFDESELTLRQLHIIEASLVKSLCSIYHGRIAYPSSEKQEKPKSRQGPEDGGEREKTEKAVAG